MLSKIVLGRRDIFFGFWENWGTEKRKLDNDSFKTTNPNSCVMTVKVWLNGLLFFTFEKVIGNIDWTKRFKESVKLCSSIEEVEYYFFTRH